MQILLHFRPKCSLLHCQACLSDSSLELLLCTERGLEKEEHLNRVQQGSSLGLANRDRIPNGRSPLAVAVVKLWRKSFEYLLLYHSGKIPVLPAHMKADQN